MADMMASGEVGLSYALHTFAHRWDQGLLLGSVFYFILYYFSLRIRLCRTYVNRIDYYFPPPPPSRPAPSVNVAAEHVTIL